MITPNNDASLQDVPHITVAGQKWPVPQLAPRQNRKVIPALMSLKGLKENVGELTEDQLDKLYSVVYYALTRAHPQLKYEEFLDWPVPAYELLEAFPVIAMQTGVIKVVPKQPDPAPGFPVQENGAGEAQSLQTGTP